MNRPGQAVQLPHSHPGWRSHAPCREAGGYRDVLTRRPLSSAPRDIRQGGRWSRTLPLASASPSLRRRSFVCNGFSDAVGSYVVDNHRGDELPVASAQVRSRTSGRANIPSERIVELTSGLTDPQLTAPSRTAVVVTSATDARDINVASAEPSANRRVVRSERRP